MNCTKASTIDLEGFVVDPRAAEWAEFREHYPRCRDCSREVARLGAVVAALASERGPAHLTDDQLLAFSTSPERLRTEQRTRVEQHLAGCAPCRTELAVLQGFDIDALGAKQWSATARLLEAMRRLGVAFVPALPKLALTAAAVALIAVSALLWRAGSEREVEGPRVARAEMTNPPELRAEPVARAPIEEVAPTPEPEPPKPTQPVHERRAAPAPRPAPPAVSKPLRAPEPQAPVRPPPTPEAPKRPVQIAALLPSEAPTYAPGALAGDTSRRIGIVARSAGAGVPAPQALAPTHVGRTSRESPTLYWFLPEATSLLVEVTVVDPDGVDPLLEETLPGPLAPGVHAVRLAEYGVRLAAGVDYQWFVTLVVDPARRSNDVVSGGSIRREAAPEVLATAPTERRAHAYAEAGLWYDAFDQLSTWLAAEPRAALLHTHRAALLEQVGLDEPARYERGAVRN